MSTDQTRILIAQMARVYLAPLGSLAPADESAALDAAWREVGLFTPDSLQFTDTPAFDSVSSHQSGYPTRRFQKGEDGSIQVDLQEFSVKNMTGVFGGGTVSQITAGHFKWSPPAIGARLDVSCIIQITDGIKQFRLIVPRCTNTEAITKQFRKTNETTLPLRLSLVGSDIGDPWYYLSNDPAWSPTAT